MSTMTKRISRLEGNRTSRKGWVLADAPENWPEERCLRRAFELLQDDLDQADATVDFRRQEGLSDVSIVYATDDLSKTLRSVAEQRRRISGSALSATVTSALLSEKGTYGPISREKGVSGND